MYRLTICLVLAWSIGTVSAYHYWGCVQDGPVRALPTLLAATSTMTKEVCESLALARGMTVFGLQYSAECFGGEQERSSSWQ
jgi:hypothetical protein